MTKVFFSGIGGSGVSALAGYMAERGNVVAGSDRLFDRIPDHPASLILRTKGITIAPQDGSGIDNSFHCAVFSTAVEADNPEYRKAKDIGITVKTRPQYLCDVISPYRTVAVAGTSGKSTTAGMLAYLMKRLGMQPSFIGGGRVKQFRGRKNLGNALAGESDMFVFEACESDGTVVLYSPSHTIITNLDLDHNPVGTTAAMFETLGRNTKERTVVNGDDRNLARCRFEKTVRFSIDHHADYHAEHIEYRPFSTFFQARAVDFRLSLPGKYNLYNALACIAVLAEMGVGIEDIAAIMPDFTGIERRFDIRLRNEQYLVIDDYAHNPHKIACLMETVQAIRERICFIFQPHGFGPTQFMKKEYIETFAKRLRSADHLMMLPIFFAGGTSVKDIASEDLCREIRLAGKRAEVLPERALLFDRLNEWDTYIVFGARDESLTGFADGIAERLQ